MEYSKRRNLNRGYMTLVVWQRAMDLFEMAFRLATSVSDFKLKSQFTDAVQSVSANIAEGYGRRSLPEYLQFLYISKGSLAEAFTRGCGLWRVHLISSLESKRATNEWQTSLPLPSKTQPGLD